MAPTVDPANKKILLVLIFAGIIMVGLLVYVVMTYSPVPGPGKSNAPAAGTPVNPVTTQPPGYITTRSTNAAVPVSTTGPIVVPTRVRTMESQQSPTSSPAVSVQTTATSIPATAAQGDSSGDVSPQPFTLTVSPASASGRPGETISYTLHIGGGEGQTEPIHFTLTANAFLISQTYDIGDEQPPFPKTTVYQFTIPSNIPSGITINGVVTATGAGQTVKQPVTLNVL
jgi:hypothetical protein